MPEFLAVETPRLRVELGLRNPWPCIPTRVRRGGLAPSPVVLPVNQFLANLLATVLSTDGIREDLSRCSVAILIGRTAIQERLILSVDVAVASSYREDVLNILVLEGERRHRLVLYRWHYGGEDLALVWSAQGWGVLRLHIQNRSGVVVS